MHGLVSSTPYPNLRGVAQSRDDFDLSAIIFPLISVVLFYGNLIIIPQRCNAIYGVYFLGTPLSYSLSTATGSLASSSCPSTSASGSSDAAFFTLIVR